MKRADFTTLSAITLSAALVCLPVAAQADTAPAVSSIVAEGKIESDQQPFPKSSANLGRATAIVDAPADQVLAVIQNYAEYKDFLPGFRASRVLSQRGAAALIYVQVDVMKGALKFWAELKTKARQGGNTNSVEATMTKGNVDIFHAKWEVTPYDANRCLVTFHIMVEPDLPIPSGVVSDENQKNARGVMKALRRRMEERKAKVAG